MIFHVFFFLSPFLITIGKCWSKNLIPFWNGSKIVIRYYNEILSFMIFHVFFFLSPFFCHIQLPSYIPCLICPICLIIIITSHPIRLKFFSIPFANRPVQRGGSYITVHMHTLLKSFFSLFHYIKQSVKGEASKFTKVCLVKPTLKLKIQ